MQYVLFGYAKTPIAGFLVLWYTISNPSIGGGCSVRALQKASASWHFCLLTYQLFAKTLYYATRGFTILVLYMFNDDFAKIIVQDGIYVFIKKYDIINREP